MSGHCKNSDCFIPDASCALGDPDYSNCTHYLKSEVDGELSTHDDDDELFPWTGRALGRVDIRVLAATRRPHVVGIAGAADAGKSTLLGLLFLSIYRGQLIGNNKFAGSMSLQGWENIARHMQLTAGEGIHFPPHTSRKGRTPGLLHFALQDDDLNTKDVLLTDASGEWFSEWIKDPLSTSAEGACWTINNSDRIIIVADTEALTGERGGPARRELDFLIRRVSACEAQKQVALVWTKSDLDRPQGLYSDVGSLFDKCFPGAPVFEIGIPEGENQTPEKTIEQLDAIFSWAFLDCNNSIVFHVPTHQKFDPFLQYGKPYEQ